MTTAAWRSGDMTIRPAERADLLAIYRIERLSFDQPWPHEAFEQFLDEPGFLVATDADRIVGFVVGQLTERYGTRAGHIKDIAVHPDTRRGGVGTRLLRRSMRVLESDGARSFRLEVRPSNGRARRLYRTHGFRARGRVDGYYTDGEDALVMVRQR